MLQLLAPVCDMQTRNVRALLAPEGDLDFCETLKDGASSLCHARTRLQRPQHTMRQEPAGTPLEALTTYAAQAARVGVGRPLAAERPEAPDVPQELLLGVAGDSPPAQRIAAQARARRTCRRCGSTREPSSGPLCRVSRPAGQTRDRASQGAGVCPRVYASTRRTTAPEDCGGCQPVRRRRNRLRRRRSLDARLGSAG
jgi:hypothetical protein